MPHTMPAAPLGAALLALVTLLALGVPASVSGKVMSAVPGAVGLTDASPLATRPGAGAFTVQLSLSRV
jgi:hypothetical protein